MCAEDIIITTGSQQALDLVGKVLIDKGELVRKYHCILIEDDPYGELCFDGKLRGYISKDGLHESILLGSFSKIITPGMRVGFMIIKNEKLRKYINTAKEAADLHSNIFAQYCLYDYVIYNNLQEHTQNIIGLYKEQCGAMISAMETYSPKDISFTRPKGGMFIWATLPEGQSAKALFDRAIERKVAFVPGDPFYTDGRVANTMRLNYTNTSKELIAEGIRRIFEL